MGETLRNIVSTLVVDTKALNLDDRLSFRYLASKFKDKLQFFFRQEARSRELLKDVNIWKTINCIDLIDVPTNACGYIDQCNTLKRSEIQLPEAYTTNYGLLIKILTIDSRKEFRQIQSNEYADYIRREYVSNKNVYWLEDRYIYIPNTEIKSVKALIMAKDTTQVDKLNNPCIKCLSPLDAEINYTDYLITLSKQEVIKELYSRMNIKEDEKGDDNTNRKN